MTLCVMSSCVLRAYAPHEADSGLAASPSREGLRGIKDRFGADDEALAGQMRRRVARYAGGILRVRAHQKDVVQVLYNDHLCVR